jgi:hypothetical protein
MHVHRITEPIEAVSYWSFFREGLEAIAQKTKEVVDEDVYSKQLVSLAAEHSQAWIGFVIDNDGLPCAFGVAQDATPPFSSRRSFTVTSFYYKDGFQTAVVMLQEAFEIWARQQGVIQYSVTTRRDTGAAIRCFSSGRFGFRRVAITFEKTLSYGK